MVTNLNKNDLVMIREAAQGLSGPEVEKFIADVRAELESLNVNPTKTMSVRRARKCWHAAN